MLLWTSNATYHNGSYNNQYFKISAFMRSFSIFLNFIGSSRFLLGKIIALAKKKLNSKYKFASSALANFISDYYNLTWCVQSFLSFPPPPIPTNWSKQPDCNIFCWALVFRSQLYRLNVCSFIPFPRSGLKRAILFAIFSISSSRKNSFSYL